MGLEVGHEDREAVALAGGDLDLQQVAAQLLGAGSAGHAELGVLVGLDVSDGEAAEDRHVDAARIVALDQGQVLVAHIRQVGVAEVAQGRLGLHLDQAHHVRVQVAHGVGEGLLALLALGRAGLGIEDGVGAVEEVLDVVGGQGELARRGEVRALRAHRAARIPHQPERAEAAAGEGHRE
ncbi:hypothetical protein D3C86_1363340 [compost metagenome]